MSFPSCWNHVRLIWHVSYRVHFCTSANACDTHFAQSWHIFKFFRKTWNTVDAEIPECMDYSTTVQRLSSVKQCLVTASHLHLCASRLWTSSAQQVNSCHASTFDKFDKATPYHPVLLVAQCDTHEHFCIAEMQFLCMTAVQLYLHPSWNTASRILTFACADY